MRYATAPAFRQGLETRLNAIARETGRSISRLRKEVVFDRLLARLVSDAPGSWILKGGLALDYRLGDRARTTKDVDLVGPLAEGEATEAMIAIQSIDPDDFFVFAVERTGALDQMEEGSAVRYRADASLAGRIFEHVLVDIGFDPPSGSWTPDELEGPDLLGFAGIPPVKIRTLPIELHIAEKVHAYTRNYGVIGRQSSRVKDLVDLAIIATESAIDAAKLSAALLDTFVGRSGHARPAALPPPPSDWRTPYRRLASGIGLDPEIGNGYRLAAQFLDPVFDGSVRKGQWARDRATWEKE